MNSETNFHTSAFLFGSTVSSTCCCLYFPRAAVMALIPGFLSPPPQERTSNANNQPRTPDGLRRSHRCKRRTERYTLSLGCVCFISAMNISFGGRISRAVVCPDESAERRLGGGLRWCVGAVGKSLSPVSHILSLGKTRACIPVARLSPKKLFNFAKQRTDS